MHLKVVKFGVKKLFRLYTYIQILWRSCFCRKYKNVTAAQNMYAAFVLMKINIVARELQQLHRLLHPLSGDTEFEKLFR
jgi:hypothetical protein